MRRTGILALTAALLLLTGCASGTPPVDDDVDISIETPDDTSPEGFDDDWDDLTAFCINGLWALDLAAWAEEVSHIFTVQAQLEAEVGVTGSALWEIGLDSYVMDVTILTTQVNVNLDGLQMETRFIITGEDTGRWSFAGEQIKLLSEWNDIDTILLTSIGGIEVNEPAPVPIPVPWRDEMTIDCLEDTLIVGMNTGSTTMFVTYNRVD